MVSRVHRSLGRVQKSLSRELSLPRHEFSRNIKYNDKFHEPNNQGQEHITSKISNTKLVDSSEVKQKKAKPEHVYDPHKETLKAEAPDSELQEYARQKIQVKTLDSIGRTGGVYIPPYKLAELQKKVTDKNSPEYQRQSWELLRKSINGLVNKVNVSNITTVVQDLFRENLQRGQGLVARSIIRAQMASPGFTHIYACLCAVLNSKLPDLGNLILRRTLLQFRRAYRRNDKLVCKACMSFFAHLINQRVVHELLALQIAMLLLEKLTDDSIEICVDFMQQVGLTLQDVVPQAFRAIMDRLRSIAQEGNVDQRVQYMIEGFQKVVATKFSEFPALIPDLDLLEDDDKITHEIDLLDTNVKGDEMLNIFKPIDPEEFLKQEAEWKTISMQILGENEEGNDSEATSTDSEDNEESEAVQETNADGTMVIKDLTEKNIVTLRKTIYLIIMSSANFEECLHKILKMNLKPGHEIHVCTMFIDCNAMERTYQPFFALQAERLCRINPVYQECLTDCFERQYATIHHLETNKIRSTAKFFAHLLHTDALSWACLEKVKLTEETTTSASRIFIKVLFQELAEQLGYKELYAKLESPSVACYLQNIFPTDSLRHVRFAINFFTAIGLGEATVKLREFLSNAQNQEKDESSDSLSTSSDDSSSDASDSDSSSSSESDATKSNRKVSKSVQSSAPSELSDDDNKSIDSNASVHRVNHRFLQRHSRSPSKSRRQINRRRSPFKKSSSIKNRVFSARGNPKHVKRENLHQSSNYSAKHQKTEKFYRAKSRSLSRSLLD